MGQAKRKERGADDAADAGTTPGLHTVEGDWRPAPLSTRARAIVAGVIVLFNIPLIHYFVFRGSPTATATVPYQNDFSNPATIGTDFWSSGGHYRVVDGWLLSPGVKNNPLWLKAKLPQNVAIDFDVKSLSPEGDIKFEVFGDGSDHASGYVLIHGGWNNSLSIIARLDEHGAKLQAGQEIKSDTRTRVEANPFPVQVGKTYHWRIERRGGLITWLIDGQKFMEFNDPAPLVGSRHDRMGFSSWEAQLSFDNLRVEPL
jgi:hypothetical protein